MKCSRLSGGGSGASSPMTIHLPFIITVIYFIHFYIALHPSLDPVASVYHLLSFIPLSLMSFHPNYIPPSFPCPPTRAWLGRQPNRVNVGILRSGMHATWPNHSSLLLWAFSAAVSVSPHLRLASVIVIRSAHL